jgi:Ca2+-binding RTX toxin-like protein
MNTPSTNMPSTAFTINGTPGDDLLLGVPGRDNIIIAGNGNDTINTFFGGNDVLDGGDGDDSFVSGPGDDVIQGGNGSDFVIAGPGDDIVDGGPGNDFVLGGEGNDLLRGGDGVDRLSGDEGNDTLYGDGNDDVIFGFFGDDVLFGGDGNDAVFGDIGSDLVFGDNGNDVLNGGTGSDRLFGGNDDDVLTGVDTFAPQPQIGRGEIDLLTGGQGRDTFALGAVLTNGSKAIFYDDGNPATPGVEDYALINDFTSGQDVIQLVGSAANYTLGQSPANLPTGTGIFSNSGGGSELIGILANNNPSDFDLNNASQFTFV